MIKYQKRDLKIGIFISHNNIMCDKNVPDIVFTWAGINNDYTNSRNRHNNELYFSIKSVLKYLS